MCCPAIDGPKFAGPVSRFRRLSGTGVGAVTFTVDWIRVWYFVTAPTEMSLSEADGRLPVAVRGAAVALSPDAHDACVDGGLGRLDHRVGPVERVLVARAPGVTENVGSVTHRVLDRLDDLDGPAVAVLERIR